VCGPRSYTGVYAERFRSGDGRINGDSDNRAGRGYTGDTNTGTDEIIHDIKDFMRPNLAAGGTVLPCVVSWLCCDVFVCQLCW
jgi:hypothetical protein